MCCCYYRMHTKERVAIRSRCDHEINTLSVDCRLCVDGKSISTQSVLTETMIRENLTEIN